MIEGWGQEQFPPFFGEKREVEKRTFPSLPEAAQMLQTQGSLASRYGRYPYRKVLRIPQSGGDVQRGRLGIGLSGSGIGGQLLRVA